MMPVPNYYNDATPLLGGFAQGLAEGKVTQQRQALAQQELDIRKAALKAETKYRESMLEMEARGLTDKEEARKQQEQTMAMIQSLLGGGGVAAPPASPVPAVPIGTPNFPVDESLA